MDPFAPVRELAERVTELTADLAKARAERDAALALVTKLAERVEALERALGSGRGGGHNGPPPKRPSLGKARGGQPSRKGKAAAKPERVDDTCEHRLHACPHCDGAVSPIDDLRERFEFEAVQRALRTASTLARNDPPLLSKSSPLSDHAAPH